MFSEGCHTYWFVDHFSTCTEGCIMFQKQKSHQLACSIRRDWGPEGNIFFPNCLGLSINNF